MTQKVRRVGFSQRVLLEWFELTADLVHAGNDHAKLKHALQDLLKEKVSVGSQVTRCSRDKIISILSKTWLSVPNHLISFRDYGLILLKNTPESEHIAIHWGMITAVYPFWSDVANQTGRLLRLQGSATAVQVQRRVREMYGERETVSRSTRRVLQCFRDWGVLQNTDSKGIYTFGKTILIEDLQLIAWLIEAALHSHGNGSASLKESLNSPSFFPFRFKSVHDRNTRIEFRRLDVVRHGMDEELVILRTNIPKSLSNRTGLAEDHFETTDS